MLSSMPRVDNDVQVLLDNIRHEDAGRPSSAPPIAYSAAACYQFMSPSLASRQADEHVAEAGGVSILRLKEVGSKLEVRPHVPGCRDQTEDESKEEIVPVEVFFYFLQ